MTLLDGVCHNGRHQRQSRNADILKMTQGTGTMLMEVVMTEGKDMGNRGFLTMEVMTTTMTMDAGVIKARVLVPGRPVRQAFPTSTWFRPTTGTPLSRPCDQEQSSRSPVLIRRRS